MKSYRLAAFLAAALLVALPVSAQASEGPPADPQYKAAVLTIHIPLRREWSSYLEETPPPASFAAYLLEDRSRRLRVIGHAMLWPGLLLTIAGGAVFCTGFAMTPSVPFFFGGAAAIIVGVPVLSFGGRALHRGKRIEVGARALLGYQPGMTTSPVIAR